MKSSALIHALVIPLLATGLALAGTTVALAAGRDTPPVPTTTTTPVDPTATTTTAAPVAAVTPARGCDATTPTDPRYSPQDARGCPTASLVKPAAVLKVGKKVTFRGRVSDASGHFTYGIVLIRGTQDRGTVVASTTKEMPVNLGVTRSGGTARFVYGPARSVAYSTLTWKSKAGSYTVCSEGTHGTLPHQFVWDCRTLVVR